MSPFSRVARRGVQLGLGPSSQNLNHARMSAGGALPAQVTSPGPGLSAHWWLKMNLQAVRECLHRVGAVLLRGFHLDSAAMLEACALELSPDALPYDYGSTPRTNVAGAVYTSTEYPAAQRIPLHNEMSYASAWPRFIFFFCEQAAAQGGATPLADSRRVYQALPAAVRERFETLGLEYVRTYDGRLDLPWQQVFRTSERTEVERYCRTHGLRFTWLDDGTLQTAQRCHGTIAHPETGDMIWFNQAHLFHPSALDPTVRAALTEECGEKLLPRNVFYGNGEPISDETLQTVRHALDAAEVSVPWQSGDLLIVDNMRVAHGREPFVGPRRVLVAMSGHADARTVDCLPRPRSC